MSKMGNEKIIGFETIQQRYRAYISEGTFSEKPAFPEKILVEITNICNHSCLFCGYRKMTRRKGVMALSLFERIMQEAFDLGAREAGLHCGSEPFACKELAKYVRRCREIGYTYVYFSTNGTIPSKIQLQEVLDAGLHSIKFSINGGNRETYRLVHGKDHFDKVHENLVFVSEYRKRLDLPLYLSISFVEVPENAHSYPELSEKLGPLVDEIWVTKAYNQSGQTPGLPSFFEDNPIRCPSPFKQVNVSVEGFLRVCCNDYQNYLALEDLKTESLMDAWRGERFVKFRRRFLGNDLKGTLCHNCMHACHEPVSPLNPELSDLEMI